MGTADKGDAKSMSNGVYFTGKCQDCKQVTDVMVRACPFEDDVHDKYVEVRICDDCYYERTQEI